MASFFQCISLRLLLLLRIAFSMSLGYKKIKFVLGEIICIMGLDYHTYVALAHFAEMYNVERLAFGITRKLLCLTIQR